MDIDIQVVDIDIGCSWFIAMALDFFHLRLAKPGVSERPKQPFVDWDMTWGPQRSCYHGAWCGVLRFYHFLSMSYIHIHSIIMKSYWFVYRHKSRHVTHHVSHQNPTSWIPSVVSQASATIALTTRTTTCPTLLTLPTCLRRSWKRRHAVVAGGPAATNSGDPARAWRCAEMEIQLMSEWNGMYTLRYIQNTYYLIYWFTCI